jgi:hypothetical protein
VRRAAAVAALAAAALLATAAQARPHLEADAQPILYVDRIASPLVQYTTIVLSMSGAPGSATASRIAVAVPKGYTMNLVRPAGSPIGGAAVLAGNTDLPSSISISYGTLVIGDPAKTAADPAAAACDPDPHIGVLEADLQEASKAPSTHVTVFVDAGDTPDAAYRLEFCPPAALKTGTAFVFSFSPPVVAEPTAAGTYTWHALVTPDDPAQTFEVRSVVLAPQTLDVHASYNAKTRTATVSGVATELAKPKAGVKLFVDADGPNTSAHLGPLTTDASGRFSTHLVVDEETDFTATVPTPDPTPCSAPSTAPGGCLSQTLSVPADKTVTLKVPLFTDAKKAFKAADRAAAARVNLKPMDFPAGWTSKPIGPDDFTACSEFHPDESTLTETGLSYSPLFVTGDVLTQSFQATDAMVKVFRTHAQALKAFYREASMDQVQCLADDPGQGYSVVSSGPLRFGRFAHAAAQGFRVVIHDDDQGTRYYLDVVVVLGKRSVATLTIESTKTPPSVEALLVAKLAARAARV